MLDNYRTACTTTHFHCLLRACDWIGVYVLQSKEHSRFAFRPRFREIGKKKDDGATCCGSAVTHEQGFNSRSMSANLPPAVTMTMPELIVRDSQPLTEVPEGFERMRVTCSYSGSSLPSLPSTLEILRCRGALHLRSLPSLASLYANLSWWPTSLPLLLPPFYGALCATGCLSSPLYRTFLLAAKSFIPSANDLPAFFATVPFGAASA